MNKNPIEGVKDFIVNIIVICVLAFLVGLSYILVKDIRDLVPGFSHVAWTLIRLSTVVFVICLILLNLKKIVLFTGNMALKGFKKLSGLLKSGVKTSRNIKVSMPSLPMPARNNKSSFGCNLPPLSLLGDLTNYKESRDHADNIKGILNKTFRDFNLDCTVTDYKIGPTITRYNLSLSSTTKIREITSIKEDLAARVKTKKLRIITSNGISIEIPNLKRQNVTHRDIMDELINEDLPPLAMACGRTANGAPYYINLAKAPHLLVGGSTGQGKSVCVNALIISLLMRNSPEHLKLVMIDPKVIEFEFYNDLPHLLFPIANTLDKSAEVIKWCVNEMNRRYIELRKIKRKNLADIPIDQRPFPVIVIVIDELAEITLSKKAGELTDDLNSLARMARAAGIHMILATQRPDKDAVPGQLKSNIPSAIALKVLKDYESRIILGQDGAEKLIGNGDMLVAAIGEEELIRCQGSFLSDQQIESVVEWWKENYEEDIKPRINICKGAPDPVEKNAVQNEIHTEKINANAEIILRKNICYSRISNNDNEIQLPTIRELANNLNISTRQVFYLLNQLKLEGWIKKTGTSSDAKNIVIISKEEAEKWSKNLQ
ncbi:MAG: DNA translocase FtsK [Bacillota bacterium]